MNTAYKVLAFLAAGMFFIIEAYGTIGITNDELTYEDVQLLTLYKIGNIALFGVCMVLLKLDAIHQLLLRRAV